MASGVLARIRSVMPRRYLIAGAEKHRAGNAEKALRRSRMRTPSPVTRSGASGGAGGSKWWPVLYMVPCV